MSQTIATLVPDPSNAFGFDHAIAESEHGPECTIHPESCGPDEIVTHWLTADEGSSVSLADAR